ncbi:hypothetical protein A6P39_043595 (plasmid) [Streptomyces sp. FXJ1.172]|uniref:hypothetical protein n=1 Tax=Streptomyces sp. FXJ1.172 TaxID=710705 RepID=UPI0023DD0327|nr:hypothetical protein [Streptomyces sp. FXJ1.172]WEP00614.1 hypothetical protein A6P39_043595 [Streptomyces sp. FXJ1.172]
MVFAWVFLEVFAWVFLEVFAWVFLEVFAGGFLGLFAAPGPRRPPQTQLSARLPHTARRTGSANPSSNASRS